jgi:HD-GYP domain-containing protein (c-di-GMP phosphodiesterase class II)
MYTILRPATVAKEIIVKGSGKNFGPIMIKVFLKAFGKREMEVPEVVL